MKSFKDYLGEMSIGNYELVGDFSKNKSFRHTQDRMLVSHPRSIERIRKKFDATNVMFNFIFVNKPNVWKFAEHGEASLDFVKKNLGDDVYQTLMQLPSLEGSINVIFTNNLGDERMPMTAHIIAHRIGHVVRWGRNYEHAERDIREFVKTVLQYYVQQRGKYKFNNMVRRPYYYGDGRKQHVNDENIAKAFLSKVCTFKSARDNNIRNYSEVLNELIAQYLTTGRIKFNKAPKDFGAATFNNNYFTLRPQDEQYANEMINYYEELLTNDIEVLFNSLDGKIFVM